LLIKPQDHDFFAHISSPHKKAPALIIGELPSTPEA